MIPLIREEKDIRLSFEIVGQSDVVRFGKDLIPLFVGFDESPSA